MLFAAPMCSSVLRKCASRAGFCLPGRPQNGQLHSRSQRFPSSSTTCHICAALETECSRQNQHGNEKAKSNPTIVCSSARRYCNSSLSTWSLESSGCKRRNEPSVASAIQSLPAGFLAPDQSMAIQVTTVQPHSSLPPNATLSGRGEQREPRSVGACCSAATYGSNPSFSRSWN